MGLTGFLLRMRSADALGGYVRDSHEVKSAAFKTLSDRSRRWDRLAGVDHTGGHDMIEGG